MALTASRRIDKCPTPGQRFSDKSPPHQDRQDDKCPPLGGGLGEMSHLALAEP